MRTAGQTQHGIAAQWSFVLAAETRPHPSLLGITWLALTQAWLSRLGPFSPE
jgi:hypothetical protein